MSFKKVARPEVAIFLQTLQILERILTKSRRDYAEEIMVLNILILPLNFS